MKICNECGHEMPDTDACCPQCGEIQPMPVSLDQLQNTFQVARWREVIEHGITVEQAQTVATDPLFVNLTLNKDDADTWGIYTELCINTGGRIAEFMTNHPYYYPTFSILLQAAAVRTATT